MVLGMGLCKMRRNRVRLVPLVGLALAAACASAQQRRVFGFNSAQLRAWYRYYGIHPPTGIRRPPTSIVAVTMSGNFGGTFTVHGAGSNTSSRADNYIDITTNRGLTFQTSGFTTLATGGSPAPTAGNVLYEMQLYAGTSSSIGGALTSAQSGIDTAFNGLTWTLAAGSIPGDGHVVLRLSRTLSLGQLAEGAAAYTANGTIVLTIN